MRTNDQIDISFQKLTGPQLVVDWTVNLSNGFFEFTLTVRTLTVTHLGTLMWNCTKLIALYSRFLPLGVVDSFLHVRLQSRNFICQHSMESSGPLVGIISYQSS